MLASTAQPPPAEATQPEPAQSKAVSPGQSRFQSQSQRQPSRLRRRLTVTAGALVTAGLFMTSLAPANADEPISIGVNVSNKIDVALAVGPTEVDYSTFEADLRARLGSQDWIDLNATKPGPTVVPEDLFITAAQAVSANTTSEFQWWTYDHTRPTGADYGGVATISDGDRTYIETAAAATSTATAAYITENPGVWAPVTGGPYTTTTAPGLQYPGGTPDATNPDYAFTGTTNTRRLRHPYMGISSHMIQSDAGATMDFYGYPQNAYRDFQFLPNNQKTRKTFEFSIEEDKAYDALDGVGFFFNTEINGSYEAGTQTMSGYLLFLGYESSGANMGKGKNLTIYKFAGVNTRDFHHAVTGATTNSAQYTIEGYTGSAAAPTASNRQFVPVVRSTIYNAADRYRRIKLDVYPSYASVYYNGSTSESAVLTTPIAEGQAAIDFAASTINGTLTQAGSKVELDSDYIGPDATDDFDYGFGPMAAYLGHGCARPTHIALQNLTMTMDKVKTLVEVVREPEWHDNTQKYLVNLNEDRIQDFTDTFITGELLNRLRNDDIYYIGWAKDEEAVEESSDFLVKNDLKGQIIDMNSATYSGLTAPQAYEAQMDAIAKEIYARYWRDNVDNVVLTTDDVTLSVSGAQATESADPEWPDGKWKVVHRLDGENPVTEPPFFNDEGIHPLSGQYLSDLDLAFNKPGYYDIYYRDQFIKTVIAHRPPVANFLVTLMGNTPTFINTSYDPDRQDPPETGIVTSEWKYLDLDVDDTPLPGVPDSLIEGHTYIVYLTVVDDLGASTSFSKQVRLLPDDPGEGGGEPGDPDPEDIAAPFADLRISPKSILKGVGIQAVSLADHSYDLQGLPITSAYSLTKDAVPVLDNGDPLVDVDLATIEAFLVNAGALPAGTYAVTLVANNGYHDSVPVVQTFTVVEDLIPPTASAAPAGPQAFTTNTPVTLTFADTGGSGLATQQVAVTTSTTPPPALDAAWTATSASSTRLATINAVGTWYIHWLAADNAGNVGSGYFGPYSLSKQDIDLALVASPASAVTYPATVTLTATLTPVELFAPAASGVVYFSDGLGFVTSATIAGGVASITYTPTLAGPLTFKAEYYGDSNYNNVLDTLAYTINKATTASVVVGPQSDKTYDGEPFEMEPGSVLVEGTSEYQITYDGRGTTVYSSTTPPTDAGEYTMTVTTTDPNYVEASDSADFEIFKRDQDALAVTGIPAPGESEPGMAFPLGTIGGSGTGDVTYVVSDPSLAQIEDDGFTLTILDKGSFTVTATKAGDTNHNPISSLPVTVSVEDITITYEAVCHDGAGSLIDPCLGGSVTPLTETIPPLTGSPSATATVNPGYVLSGWWAAGESLLSPALATGSLDYVPARVAGLHQSADYWAVFQPKPTYIATVSIRLDSSGWDGVEPARPLGHMVELDYGDPDNRITLSHLGSGVFGANLWANDVEPWAQGYAVFVNGEDTGAVLDVTDGGANAVQIDYYQAIYHANGGSGAIPPALVYQDGADVAVLNGPTGPPSGTHFAGWSTSSAAAAVDHMPGDDITVSDTVHLYAVWTSNQRYPVTYNLNGGTGTLDDPGSPYAAGQLAPVLGAPAHTITPPAGSHFVGWATSPTAGAPDPAYEVGSQFTVSGAVALFAQWAPNPTVTLTFDGNGTAAGVPSAITVTE
ncbi:MAG: InlB B-repeat-containing protein, partial [Micrococcales bacterium]|nr:InlB B-repeat-containing protein [Micrococcales bacterium]